MDQPSKLSRRAALQTLATGVGAGVAAPLAGLAASEQVQEMHQMVVAEDQTAGATATGRAFFSDHQFSTLRVLATLILPGSEASGTPEFLDKLLAVDTADARRRFISALGAFDGAAMRAHGRGFKDVTTAQQTAILTQASTMAPAPTVVASGDPTAGVSIEPSNLRDYFDHLKGWITDIHFSSEAGQRELGWTGNMFFTKFNACGTSTT